MSNVNRRDFLKGLIATAAAASLPAVIPDLVEPAIERAGNTLISPDLVAKEALAALRKHIDLSRLVFRKDYDINRDRMIYLADYRVPAHETTPKAELEGVPLGDPRMDESFTVTREFVPEVHYQVGIEIDGDFEDELPAIQAMMAAEIEDRLQPA